MKNRIFLILLICGLTCLLLNSCIDDKGNYVYDDLENVMPVTIDGIRDTTIMINTVLRIEPVVQNTDKADYT